VAFITELERAGDSLTPPSACAPPPTYTFMPPTLSPPAPSLPRARRPILIDLHLHRTPAPPLHYYTPSSTRTSPPHLHCARTRCIRLPRTAHSTHPHLCTPALPVFPFLHSVTFCIFSLSIHSGQNRKLTAFIAPHYRRYYATYSHPEGTNIAHWLRDARQRTLKRNALRRGTEK